MNIARWCESSASDLVAELNANGLDYTGFRWDHVQTLIKAESVVSP